MDGKKNLMKEQIKAIIDLHKKEADKRNNKDCACYEMCVYRWVRNFSKDGGVATLGHKKRPGPGRQTSARTLNVIKVDADPQITVRELR